MKSQKGHIKCKFVERSLEQFRELFAWDFQLVLCAEVPGSMVDCALNALKDFVEVHKDGEFGYLLSQSSIISTIPGL